MASAANVNDDNCLECLTDYWNHIPRLHSCQHCDRIVITHHELENCLISLPHTESEAHEAQMDQCPVFCKLNNRLPMSRDPPSYGGRPYGSLLDFFRLLFDPNYPQSLFDPHYPEICYPVPESTASTATIAAQKKARSNLNIAKLLWRAQFMLGNLRRRHFNLFVSTEGLYALQGTNAIKCHWQLEILEEREGVIDLNEDLFRHVLRRNSDTREVYANLKTFISSCLSSHRACQMSPTGFVPSRLLEVSPNSDPNHMRLVEATSEGQKTWACLSYVWGGDQHHKTTRSILPEYSKDICLDVLPQTIKDAVRVCRELGIAYLWIDSFCIVQDDEADKAREIPQMALIYRHALLTIAASCSHTVDEGFLRHVPPLCYQEFPPTSLRFKDRRGRESKVVVLTEKHRNDVFHEPKEPIDARAWALQEQLLSPRLLSYTSHGLRWSCRCLLQHVNGHPDRASLPRQAWTSPHLNGAQIIPCIPGLKMQSWESVVTLYSRRRATLYADKLVALSAVARTYSENNQEYGTYLAGIWEKSLPLSLMWKVLIEDVHPRPLEYRAPSWSWASVDGAVQYTLQNLKVDNDFEFITAQTRTVDSNEFGAVTAGTLVVDARVRDCRVGKKNKKFRLGNWFNIVDGPEIQFEADTTGFWTFCNEVTEVTLLHAARDERWRHGLVLTKNNDGFSFSRVSYFSSFNTWTSGPRRMEYERFFEKFKIKRITIV